MTWPKDKDATATSVRSTFDEAVEAPIALANLDPLASMSFWGFQGKGYPS